jgi:hypothetical protein
VEWRFVVTKADASTVDGKIAGRQTATIPYFITKNGIEMFPLCSVVFLSLFF